MKMRALESRKLICIPCMNTVLCKISVLPTDQKLVMVKVWGWRDMNNGHTDKWTDLNYVPIIS